MSKATEEAIQKAFEAQLETRQAPNQNRDKSAAILDHLRQRLETLVVEGDPENNKERLRLQEDIKITRQFQELCKAIEPSQQKIHIFGDTIVDNNSDQVALTTVADQFYFKKAVATRHSVQTTGSMTSEDLQNLNEKRYISRFGALVANSSPTEAGANPSPSVPQASRSVDICPPLTISSEHSQGLRASCAKPSPTR